MVRRYAKDIVAQSTENTLAEPWPRRLQTAVYIASGGKMWLARLFTWIVVGLTAWNVWQILH